MTTSANRVVQDALGLSEHERAEIDRRGAALDAGAGTASWGDARRDVEAAIRRK